MTSRGDTLSFQTKYTHTHTHTYELQLNKKQDQYQLTDIVQ